MTNEQIGLRIKELRSQKGLSQEELARRVELPRTAVTKIESGSQELRFRELEKFAEALGTPISALVEKPHESPASVMCMSSTFMDDSFMMTSESSEEYKASNTRLRTMLLFILQRTAGNPEMDDRRIADTILTADRLHREAYSHTISRLTHTSRPELEHAIQETINEMIERNELTPVTSNRSTTPRYLPETQPDLQLITAAEYIMMEKAIS